MPHAPGPQEPLYLYTALMAGYSRPAGSHVDSHQKFDFGGGVCFTFQKPELGLLDLFVQLFLGCLFSSNLRQMPKITV